MSRRKALAAYKSVGVPRFAPSCVLFYDLLGVTAMSTGPTALDDLRRLRPALERARERAGTEDPQQSHASTWFTDNVVIGTPVFQWPQDQEGALLYTVVNVSYMQLILLDAGFLGRGGIAFGEHFMDRNTVFGPALIDAVGMEKATVQPRIALTPDAAALALKVFPASGYGDPKNWPLGLCLAVDEQDGAVFVDVFGTWFGEEDDLAVANHYLASHRARIEAGLLANAGQPKELAKWQWLADYFNWSVGQPGSLVSQHLTPAAPGVSTFKQFWELV